ncbi:hypothetical protein BH09MYX1_BH09MYX1_44760 [soil metagenome]
MTTGAKTARDAAILAPRGADFDAHGDERSRSTMFSAARVDLQRRLLGWGRAVAGRYGDLGIAVSCTASDPLLIGRDGPQVGTQEVTLQFKKSKGAVLKLSVDADSIHLGLRLDGKEELDAIDDAVPTPTRASRVAAAFASLPEQLELGLDDPWSRVQVRSVTELRQLARRARAEARPIAVSFRVPRDVALLFAASLGDTFADAAVALGELLRALGAAGDPDREKKKTTIRGLERGERVRPIDGPFAGREGLIQELDGRGGARVLFGLLAVHIDLKDLRPALQTRLRLGSSHRRLKP